MWNGHFDGLLRPHRAFPDMGSFLNNDQFAVLHNILSVVGVFSITLYTQKSEQMSTGVKVRFRVCSEGPRWKHAGAASVTAMTDENGMR